MWCGGRAPNPTVSSWAISNSPVPDDSCHFKGVYSVPVKLAVKFMNYHTIFQN